MNPGERWRGRLVAAIFILGVLAPGVVFGQTGEEEKAQARELYERATRLYDVGKYGEAISAYEQAYLLVEDPALLFNIGQAYRLWDRPEDAVRAYKNYLRKRPEARNRVDVERKIADLEKIIEDRRSAASAPAQQQPPPFPVTPAPAPPLSASPPQPAPPPAAYQAPPQDVPVPVPGPALAPVPPPAVEPVEFATSQVPEAPAPPKRNWLAYGLMGGGGVCLVFAAVMAAVGRADAQKLRDASKNHEAFDPAVENNGKAANGLAVVGLVAGVATGAVGGYLLWRGRGADTTSATLVPTLTPSYAGGAAVVAF